MRVAVLADVHANLPALEAVVSEVERMRPDEVIVLGDLIGYNAHPEECVDIIRSRGFRVVQGNHDHDAVHGTPSIGTHQAARVAQQWTREQLCPDTREYLAGLPSRLSSEADLVAVHGCYLNDRHFTGYVTSTMLKANLKAVASNDTWPHVALCGHTHCPMIGWLLADEEVVEPPPTQVTEWPARARAVVINPGAVGQPRDGDPRAAFAVIDSDRRTVTQHRVEYDVERACKAILGAGLPAGLAQRLTQGL